MRLDEDGYIIRCDRCGRRVDLREDEAEADSENHFCSFIDALFTGRQRDFRFDFCSTCQPAVVPHFIALRDIDELRK